MHHQIPNRFENNAARRNKKSAADMSLQNILGIDDEKVGSEVINRQISQVFCLK